MSEYKKFMTVTLNPFCLPIIVKFGDREYKLNKTANGGLILTKYGKIDVKKNVKKTL